MDDLKRTPLYDQHMAQGARMVAFAGYDMPVQYAEGVMAEHLHCRAGAGLFDVSHMGQIWVEGPSWETVARGFERLVPQDVAGLADGRQRYGFFTTVEGGIADDLMFARREERLFVVVNAACKSEDLALMRAELAPELQVSEVTDRALIAVQGPKAEAVLAEVGFDCRAMRFMDVAAVTWERSEVWASRSGYTGEDGFEISVPAAEAAAFWKALNTTEDAGPVGLGARDSLRLEAGLCLYGQDIDRRTSPVEAGLGWAIQKSRRRGGAREGGFPGADRILTELEECASRLRVGLRPAGRAPMRAGVPLHASDATGDPVGAVTSGGFGPSIGAPVAMGYVPAEHSVPGTRLWGELRGKRLPVDVAELPFVPARFKR